MSAHPTSSLPARKHLVIAIVIVIGAVVMGPLTANAQQGDWQAGLRGTWMAPHESSGIFAATGDGLQVDTGFAPQAHVAYLVGDDWALELGLAVTKLAATTTTAQEGQLDAGDVRLYPLTLTLLYHVPLVGKVSPYVGAGVCYTRLGYDISPELASFNVRSFELDPAFGLAGQAGVSYDLGDRWSVNLNAKYLGMPSQVDVWLQNGELWDRIDLDLDPLVIGVGVAYWF